MCQRNTRITDCEEDHRCGGRHHYHISTPTSKYQLQPTSQSHHGPYNTHQSRSVSHAYFWQPPSFMGPFALHVVVDPSISGDAANLDPLDPLLTYLQLRLSPALDVAPRLLAALLLVLVRLWAYLRFGRRRPPQTHWALSGEGSKPACHTQCPRGSMNVSLVCMQGGGCMHGVSLWNRTERVRAPTLPRWPSAWPEQPSGPRVQGSSQRVAQRSPSSGVGCGLTA